MGEATDKPKLRSIPGQRIDPEDVNDTPEELEALAIRLAQDIATIDTEYDPIRRVDAQIMQLRNGLDIAQEIAETEGAVGAGNLVDQSIRAYITEKELGAPTAQYSASAKDMAQALTALREAIFSSHQLELGHKFPSPAWDMAPIRDALHEGFAHAGAVIAALCPVQPGEDPKQHKKRMESFLDEAAADLLRRAANPPV